MSLKKNIIELNKTQKRLIKNIDLTINKLEKIKLLVIEIKELGLDITKVIQ